MEMAQQHMQSESRAGMPGIKRLGLRVSEMINHPVAQVQRWVTIHRLDTDGDREWNEVMGLLAETDGLDMTLNEDESVTLKWEPPSDEYRVIDSEDAFTSEEAVPF